MLASAVENAGEGIGILNQDWILTYANTALARTLGQAKPADILGRHWQSFCDPSNLDQHASILATLQQKAR
ncbi:MAG TPA: PAS domain-containing protein [Phycisphaerae bacterium]|nr:PAS domain-containing protein [Phycisphaerae bacterium]HOJ75575.1 PAS domain-containing protein [Phycisphaerae bacterium]HOM50229.1 PAS domain-containing protein [Phycisphaerae bacterium]HOQ88362.1 PAS domain-containing protein [Phycisphaerae bacterium]HPP27534.1 PAS domain-containing protein [Phycisphaerae bacterium]